MRLAIVIGHSKKSPGAFAAAPLRLSEYDYNTLVAQEIYRNAMGRGVHTKIFTRDGSSIKDVYQQVEDWAAKTIYGKTVAVELHFNAANKKAKGTETLFDMEPLESIEFARCVQQAMCLVFKRKGKEDRGLKKITEDTERGYPNLNYCRIPSVIVEPAFGDNPDEAKLLSELQLDYAKSIVDATIQYFMTSGHRGPLN